MKVGMDASMIINPAFLSPTSMPYNTTILSCEFPIESDQINARLSLVPCPGCVHCSLDCHCLAVLRPTRPAFHLLRQAFTQPLAYP